MDINALQKKIIGSVPEPDMPNHEFWKATYYDKREILDLLDAEIVKQTWGRSEGLQMAKAIIVESATEYRWTQETVKK